MANSGKIKELVLLLLFPIFLGGSCSGASVPKESKGKSMGNNMLNSWSPCLSAPFNFTAAVEWFYVKYGMNSAVGLAGADKDLFEDGMTLSRPIDCRVNLFSPKGVDLVWASWMERKWYVAEINFSEQEEKIIKDALHASFPSFDDEDYLNPKQKKGSYGIFHVCCFPGGKLRYFLESNDYNRIISLDLVSQAAETHELDETFLHGGRGMIRREEKYWEDMNDYFDDMLHEGKYKMEMEAIEREFGEETRQRLEYHQEHGAPDPALWNSYFKRYNYKVSVVMEDSASELLQETCHFTNAELYQRYLKVNPDNVIASPAALKKLVFEWKSKGFIYSCYIYFNEEETFRVFQEAFGDDSDKTGQLKIFVSKYNNYLDISLSVGEKTYVFEKMQIDIGRREGVYDDTERVYENYEGAHQEFVGR